MPADSPSVEVFELWTDGACSAVVGKGEKGRGAGGWAAILIAQGGLKLGICGSEQDTTNNRMELMAVIRGLAAIGEKQSIVTIHTDSAYVKNAHTQGWLKGWQQNGWRSHRGDPVANRDLWEQLEVLVRRHFVKWRKVKGHSISVLNNEVDALAVGAKHGRYEHTEVLSS